MNIKDFFRWFNSRMRYRYPKYNRISSSYSGSNRTTYYKGTSKSSILAFLYKSFICIIVVTILFGLKSLNMELTNRFIDVVKYSLNYQYDISKDFRRIKYVFQEYLPQARDYAVKVFNNFGNQSNSQSSAVALIPPLNGKVTSGFGQRVHPVYKDIRQHNGIDIDAKEGTDVKAALDGVVVSVEDDPELGKVVVLKHPNNLQTVYGHLSTVLVKLGEPVGKGQVIAKSGNTGVSSAPHLHFEVWENGKPVDPLTKIDLKQIENPTE